jgi:hypothetical protein
MKGFMRPVLTLSFTAGFGYLTWMSYKILESNGIYTLSSDQAVLYFGLAIDTCVMLTTTCVTWWFADRRMARNLQQMHQQRLDQQQLDKQLNHSYGELKAPK